MTRATMASVVVALLGLAACGGGGNRDSGPGGIDANIPANDAFVATCGTMADENTAATCGDGCDNDGDRFADCDDFDCCGAVTCAPGTACGDRGDAGPRADAAVMECATAGMENTAGACGDGCDNEPDGFADCSDFDCCDLVTCGADTGCGRRASGESNPTNCNDTRDNDGDTFIDCDDRDCCGVREMSTCGATTYIGRGACA